MADLDGWIERDVASVWHGFTQMEAYAGNRPIIVERAEGRELIDVEGNRYLDAISSLWVTTLGHTVPELDQAVRDQLGKVAHSTLLGNGNRIVIELAEALAPRVPVDRPRFLFASDGAAAVEQALKIAFQFWTNQGVTSRTKYLAFSGAYHGDTIGSLAVGDGGFGTDVFDPLRFPVLRAPSLGEPGAIDRAVELIVAHAHELAAVVLEPLVQGAAGMALVPAEGVAAVARAAQEHDVLVIHDEVATGFGRTGTLFATEQCGVQPDLMVIGKGITGGYLPLAATVASQRVWEAFLGPDLSERTFYHGHSYSGNALGCAVALRHLELIDEWDVLANVTDRAEQLGDLLAERIEPLDGVAEVRRCGLMTGVELAPPAEGLRWGRKVSAGCVDRGVLIRPLGDVVVLMPPLTTTAAEVVRIVDALEAAIREGRGRVNRTGGDWPAWLHGQLSTIRDQGRWRAHREFDAWGQRGTLVDPEQGRREVVSFASNDYLGLTTHPAVVAAAHAAIDRWGTGSGASRLVTGDRPVHEELELELAAWKQTEAAVVLPTGFATNLAVLSTLGGPGVTIISDELNHASIIDGARLARASVAISRHRDLADLEALVADAPGPVIVVADTVFSMDGDALDVRGTADVCRRHQALLVLDEAHAVLGPDPSSEDLAGIEVVRVGTLSKTLGSLGGFAACSQMVRDLLVNAARPSIFTTGLSPADAAAGLAAVRVVRSAEGAELTATLRRHVDRLQPGHPSPIVPIVLGDERRAVAAASSLLEQGLLVPAIRPPTVAPGTSRLRVTVSASHTDDEVGRLVDALAAFEVRAPGEPAA